MLEVVYDVSARTNGPSLNDCLYAGPGFSQAIIDTVIPFQFYKIVVAGDIKKAFLMVFMNVEDKDAFRFIMWISSIDKTDPKVVVY